MLHLCAEGVAPGYPPPTIVGCTAFQAACLAIDDTRHIIAMKNKSPAVIRRAFSSDLEL